MRVTEANVNQVSAVVFTAISTVAAGVFFVVTLVGDYDWVARAGGTFWVFLLAMIITMPTVIPLMRARATGTPVQFGVHDHAATMAAEASARTAKDPVCGMDVDPAKAAGMSEFRGRTYYFCNLNCKKAFDGDPEKYTGS